MGRALHGARVRARLESLAPYYKLGNKMPDVLEKTKGLRDLPADLEEQLALYCVVDTNLCRALFELMAPHFSPIELWLIDCTIRMYTQPTFHLDRSLAERGKRARREGRLAEADAPRRTAIREARSTPDRPWCHAAREVVSQAGGLDLGVRTD
jgi:hypothetical protein